ncbi:unnamed protein product [Litomosoides sigmodontis]|uniref:Uncharacterized protein n=1 Tax=Litomosoides sigmodontis TaxID=42156 RepID=A0A3P6SSR6_LITSI|nr:unnamed protein product [Litomosoides sigmodontis]
MAEVEDCRTFQVNGIEAEERKTKIVEDDEALNDEPLNTENSQVSEMTLEEMESDDVEEMDDRVTLDEQQENGLSTVMEGEELSAVEVMQRAVEIVEAGSEPEHKESGIDQGKRMVEEQTVEDRIEHQVPDITGTNADIMTTSMDSIEELPTSEEQAMEIETSALTEQKTDVPVQPGNFIVEVALTAEAAAEAEALTEEDQTTMSSEVEASQEINKIEAVLEEQSAPVEVEESTPVQDDEATEQHTASPETKFEVEIQEMSDARSEMEQAQDTLKHAEPFEITEDITAEQSLITDESETVLEESSGAGAGAEGTQKEEDVENERIEPTSNVDLSNEEKQSEIWGNETIKLSEDNLEKTVSEESIASAQPAEEKLEAIYSSRASSLPDETNDASMTTPLAAAQEFTFDESLAKSIIEDKVLSRKISATEEKYPSRKTSAIGEAPSRKVSAVKENALSRQASVAQNEKAPSRKSSEVREKKPLSRKSSAIQETGPPSRKTSEIDGDVPRRKTSTVQEEKIPSRKSSAIRKVSSEIKEEEKIAEISPKLTEALESVKEERIKLVKGESEAEPEPESNLEDTVAEVLTAELQYKIPTKDIADEVKKIREAEKVDESEKYAAADKRKSPSPVRQRISSPRKRSPSPIRKRQDVPPSPIKGKAVYESSYRSYDHDTYRQRGPPPRIPSYLSFSSYTPVERTTYTPMSSWIQNTAQKYRSNYSTASTYKPQPIYTSIFDDIVSSGPFSSSLYSANRLLERSRSRSRELRNAHRSKRSTSNYYRYTSNYAITPLRTRDYSTPPLSSVYHPSRSGSFISFLAYSKQKRDELERSSSRISAIDEINRASSRSNVGMFYGKERLSRVDSYVRDSSRNADYGFVDTYSKYRSSSRPYLQQVYTPTTRYTAYPATYLPSSHNALSHIHSGFSSHWSSS